MIGNLIHFTFISLFVSLSTGNALIKCGETENQIGGAEREFIQSSAINFLTPFRNFLEGDFKTILVRSGNPNQTKTLPQSQPSHVTSGNS